MTAESEVVSFIGIMTMAILSIVLLLAFDTYRRIADRYRLKYGFDKDIELKELNNPNNLERRENAFKKRVYKD